MIQMPRLVSLLLMATLIVFLGLMFYQVVAPFLMPLFLAAVMAILCQPIHKRSLRWTKNRPAIAAGLTTVIILASILGPLIVGTISAARQLDRMAKNRPEGRSWKSIAEGARKNATVQAIVTRYGQLTGDPVNMDEIEDEVDLRLREVTEELAKRTLGSAGATLSLLGGAVSVLIGAMAFVIALYYFLADGPGLVEATMALIPVNPEYQRQLITQFDSAVRAVVSATFAAAVGQGIATGIGLEIAEKWRVAQIEAWLAQGISIPGDVPLGGISYFFVATILATLTALVPLLGTWLIWGPYALWLWYTGHWMPAGFIAFYGVVVVGLLDNVIRTYVLNSNVKLHPLLAFISVLGGVQALGLWGVFVGPIVASCLHALVRIFNIELVAFSQDRKSRSPGASDAPTVVMSAIDVQRPASPTTGTTPKPAANSPRPASATQAEATGPVDGSSPAGSVSTKGREEKPNIPRDA
jgi:predicted PurR-regulated permease PerM